MLAAVAVSALLVILYVSQSARVGTAHLAGPIVFVVTGAALGLSGPGAADSTTSRGR